MNAQAADVGKEQSRSKYDRLIAAAKRIPPAATLVVHPCDESSLRGVIEATSAGLIAPTLVGPALKIKSAASKHGIDIEGLNIVDAPHSEAAAAKAVELIHAAKGEMLMKGSLHTDELMRSVIAKAGLRTERRISHVFIMDVPAYDETVFITDAAINIFPDLDCKRDIIQNAIDLFTQAGFGALPRVAILSAVETVTSKIPSTIEAAALCKMADRGQITGGLLDGPLAFDNAIDREAARIKGIKSEVAGRAQILVVPDLESGNMLAKNLAYFAKADGAGIVLGARVPIVLTSRADSLRARLASCAVATLYADARRRRATTAAA
jgi:phosphate acetyltransferase